MLTTLGVTSRTNGASVGTLPPIASGICAQQSEGKATQTITART